MASNGRRPVRILPVATAAKHVSGHAGIIPADAAVMEEIISDLQFLGYIIEPLEEHLCNPGTPADVEAGNEKHTIDILLEQYKHFSRIKILPREKLVRSRQRL